MLSTTYVAESLVTKPFVALHLLYRQKDRNVEMLVQEKNNNKIKKIMISFRQKNWAACQSSMHDS
jgi:hypothetical protein